MKPQRDISGLARAAANAEKRQGRKKAIVKRVIRRRFKK